MADPEGKTGDKVRVTGHYICENGSEREYRAGEEFGTCPQTGGSIGWHLKSKEADNHHVGGCHG